MNSGTRPSWQVAPRGCAVEQPMTPDPCVALVLPCLLLDDLQWRGTPSTLLGGLWWVRLAHGGGFMPISGFAPSGSCVMAD